MRGAGRVVFAAILLMIVGTINIIYGIGALDDANIFVNDTRFILDDLNTLGWVLIILGVIQLTAGFSLIAGNTYGRVIGIIAGSLGALGALFSIGGSNPWWSLCVFALCVYDRVRHHRLRRGRADSPSVRPQPDARVRQGSGTLPLTHVPSPDVDSIASRPPIASIRSRMLARPAPAGFPFTSNPTPSSRTSNRRPLALAQRDQHGRLASRRASRRSAGPPRTRSRRLSRSSTGKRARRPTLAR